MTAQSSGRNNPRFLPKSVVYPSHKLSRQILVNGDEDVRNGKEVNP
jgi:hypothetical protein